MKRGLSFYLDDAQRAKAEAGRGIFGAVAVVVKAAGWDIRYRDPAADAAGAGYHLVYNRPVEGAFCLSLRRCYLEKYYRIEATNDRWDWDVARLAYSGGRAPAWFQTYWRDRLFEGYTIGAGGYIFMPLQGKLLQRRHFQAASPVEMIRATQAADPARAIIATLHPREVYSEAEMEALRGIDRFTLVADSMSALAGCEYVVTENSSLALSGFFADKPAVLFARIDFHHIAASIQRLGIAEAFASVRHPRPYADYLHWFFKKQALCEVADDRVAQVAERLRAHGWPV